MAASFRIVLVLFTILFWLGQISTAAPILDRNHDKTVAARHHQTTGKPESTHRHHHHKTTGHHHKTTTHTPVPTTTTTTHHHHTKTRSTPSPKPTTTTSASHHKTTTTTTTTTKESLPGLVDDLTSSISRSGGTYSGDGTWYTPGLGSCGWTNTASQLIGAMNYIQMANGANPNSNPNCGREVRIHGPNGSVTVKIVDTVSCTAPLFLFQGNSSLLYHVVPHL